MPKIFELFGYPVTDKSSDVQESRSQAFCPFMSATCDGGGNRFQSEINLSEHDELKKFFRGIDKVPSGICSIQLRDDASPWIICPRRLFYPRQNSTNDVQKILLSKCNFPHYMQIGVWSEVKIKYKADTNRNFDYAFDYIFMPIVEGIPVGSPVIIEVMTSSTSGGNKKIRSTIPQAFEDCMLGKNHIAPGINYRQVWARMASQLLVKSQVATAWGGKTIWIIQDSLADYISSTTALNLQNFISEQMSEVNILSFAYDNYENPATSKTLPLKIKALYSGEIHSSEKVRPCFQDIILTSVCPPRQVLISALSKKTCAKIFKEERICLSPTNTT